MRLAWPAVNVMLCYPDVHRRGLTMNATWFLVALAPLFAFDAVLTLWILRRNGRRVDPIMGTPVRWWGLEGVALVKVVAFAAIVYVALLVPGALTGWMRAGLLVVYALVCVWDVRAVRHIQRIAEHNKRLDRIIERHWGDQ